MKHNMILLRADKKNGKQYLLATERILREII